MKPKSPVAFQRFGEWKERVVRILWGPKKAHRKDNGHFLKGCRKWTLSTIIKKRTVFQLHTYIHMWFYIPGRKKLKKKSVRVWDTGKLRAHHVLGFSGSSGCKRWGWGWRDNAEEAGSSKVLLSLPCSTGSHYTFGRGKPSVCVWVKSSLVCVCRRVWR